MLENCTECGKSLSGQTTYKECDDCELLFLEEQDEVFKLKNFSNVIISVVLMNGVKCSDCEEKPYLIYDLDQPRFMKACANCQESPLEPQQEMR